MKWLELSCGVIYSVSLLVSGVIAMRSDWWILATSAIFWSGVGAFATFTSFMLHKSVKDLEKYDFVLKSDRSSDS